MASELDGGLSRVAGSWVKIPGEELGGSLTRGEEVCPDCLITKNRPEMSLARAGRFIHHVQWEYQRPRLLNGNVGKINPNSLLAMVSQVDDIGSCATAQIQRGR